MEPRKLSQEIISRLRSGFSISSVAQGVNELVLNSLDAKSKNIAVRINLQIFKIQVVDDGEGISKNNLQWVGTRYMTNKCHTLKDFEKISKFYGFKGESLAGIKEHAKRMIISTKCSGFETFSKVLDSNVNDIVVIKDRPSHGTTVTIEDFLYNLPIRRNVVNADLELSAIRSNLEALSIIHPSVSFTLRNDVNRKMIFTNCKCDSVELSLINLHPRLKSENFGALKMSSQVMSVIGLIYKELVDFKAQHIYVNKRAVECNGFHRLIFDELVSSAIFKKERKETFCYLFNMKCPNSYVEFSASGSKTFAEFKEWNAVVKFMQKFLDKFLKREGLKLAAKKMDVIERKVPSIRDIRLSTMGGACKSKIASRRKRNSQFSSVDLNNKEKAISIDNKDLTVEKVTTVSKIKAVRGVKKPRCKAKCLKTDAVVKSVKQYSVCKIGRMKHRKLAKQLILSASNIDKNVFKKLFSGRISDDETSNPEDRKNKRPMKQKSGKKKKAKLQENVSLENPDCVDDENIDEVEDEACVRMKTVDTVWKRKDCSINTFEDENPAWVDEDKTYVTMKTLDTFWNINNQKIGKAMVMEKFLKSVIRREECEDDEVCEKVAASVSIKISRKTVGKYEGNCKPSVISTMSFTQMISVKNDFLSNNDAENKDNFERLHSSENSFKRFDEEFDYVEDFRLDPNFTKPILKKSQRTNGIEFNNRLKLAGNENFKNNVQDFRSNGNFTKPVLKRSKGNLIESDTNVSCLPYNKETLLEKINGRQNQIHKNRYQFKDTEENILFAKGQRGRFKQEHLHPKNIDRFINDAFKMGTDRITESVLMKRKRDDPEFHKSGKDENALPISNNNFARNSNNAQRVFPVKDDGFARIPNTFAGLGPKGCVFPVKDGDFQAINREAYHFEDQEYDIHKRPDYFDDNDNVQNYYNFGHDTAHPACRDYYNNLEDEINNGDSKTHNRRFNPEDEEDCNLEGEGKLAQKRHFNYGRNIAYNDKNFEDKVNVGHVHHLNFEGKEDCFRNLEDIYHSGRNFEDEVNVGHVHHLNFEDTEDCFRNLEDIYHSSRNFGDEVNFKERDNQLNFEDKENYLPNNKNRKHYYNFKGRVVNFKDRGSFENDKDFVRILEDEGNKVPVHHFNLEDKEDYFRDTEHHRLNLPGCSKKHVDENGLHKLFKFEDKEDTAHDRHFSFKNKINPTRNMHFPCASNQDRNRNIGSYKCYNFEDFPDYIKQQKYLGGQFNKEPHRLVEDYACNTEYNSNFDHQFNKDPRRLAEDYACNTEYNPNFGYQEDFASNIIQGQPHRLVEDYAYNTEYNKNVGHQDDFASNVIHVEPPRLVEDYACNTGYNPNFGHQDDFASNIIQDEAGKRQSREMRERNIKPPPKKAINNARNPFWKSYNFNFRNEFHQKREEDFVVNLKTGTNRPPLENNLQQFSRRHKLPRHNSTPNMGEIGRKQFVRRMQGFEDDDILHRNFGVCDREPNQDFCSKHMSDDFIDPVEIKGKHENFISNRQDFAVKQDRRQCRMNQDQKFWMDLQTKNKEEFGFQRDPKDFRNYGKVQQADIQNFKRYRSLDNYFSVEEPKNTKEQNDENARAGSVDYHEAFDDNFRTREVYPPVFDDFGNARKNKVEEPKNTKERNEGARAGSVDYHETFDGNFRTREVYPPVFYEFRNARKNKVEEPKNTKEQNDGSVDYHETIDDNFRAREVSYPPVFRNARRNKLPTLEDKNRNFAMREDLTRNDVRKQNFQMKHHLEYDPNNRLHHLIHQNYNGNFRPPNEHDFEHRTNKTTAPYKHTKRSDLYESKYLNIDNQANNYLMANKDPMMFDNANWMQVVEGRSIIGDRDRPEKLNQDQRENIANLDRVQKELELHKAIAKENPRKQKCSIFGNTRNKINPSKKESGDFISTSKTKRNLLRCDYEVHNLRNQSKIYRYEHSRNRLRTQLREGQNLARENIRGKIRNVDEDYFRNVAMKNARESNKLRLKHNSFEIATKTQTNNKFPQSVGVKDPTAHNDLIEGESMYPRKDGVRDFSEVQENDVSKSMYPRKDTVKDLSEVQENDVSKSMYPRKDGVRDLCEVQENDVSKSMYPRKDRVRDLSEVQENDDSKAMYPRKDRVRDLREVQENDVSKSMYPRKDLNEDVYKKTYQYDQNLALQSNQLSQNDVDLNLEKPEAHPHHVNDTKHNDVDPEEIRVYTINNEGDENTGHAHASFLEEDERRIFGGRERGFRALQENAEGTRKYPSDPPVLNLEKNWSIADGQKKSRINLNRRNGGRSLKVIRSHKMNFLKRESKITQTGKSLFDQENPERPTKRKDISTQTSQLKLNEETSIRNLFLQDQCYESKKYQEANESKPSTANDKPSYKVNVLSDIILKPRQKLTLKNFADHAPKHDSIKKAVVINYDNALSDEENCNMPTQLKNSEGHTPECGKLVGLPKLLSDEKNKPTKFKNFESQDSECGVNTFRKLAKLAKYDVMALKPTTDEVNLSNNININAFEKSNLSNINSVLEEIASAINDCPKNQTLEGSYITEILEANSQSKEHVYVSNTHDDQEKQSIILKQRFKDPEKQNFAEKIRHFKEYEKDTLCCTNKDVDTENTVNASDHRELSAILKKGHYKEYEKATLSCTNKDADTENTGNASDHRELSAILKKDFRDGKKMASNSDEKVRALKAIAARNGKKISPKNIDESDNNLSRKTKIKNVSEEHDDFLNVSETDLLDIPIKNQRCKSKKCIPLKIADELEFVESHESSVVHKNSTQNSIDLSEKVTSNINTNLTQISKTQKYIPVKTVADTAIIESQNPTDSARKSNTENVPSESEDFNDNSNFFAKCLNLSMLNEFLENPKLSTIQNERTTPDTVLHQENNNDVRCKNINSASSPLLFDISSDVAIKDPESPTLRDHIFTAHTSLFNFCSSKPEEISSQDVKFNMSINFEELCPSNHSKLTTLENDPYISADINVSFERPNFSNYVTDSEQEADVILESTKSPYDVNLKRAKNSVNHTQLNVQDKHTKLKAEENIFAKNVSNYVTDSEQDADVILESTKSPYDVNLKRAKNSENHPQLNVRDKHRKFKAEENLFAKNVSNYVTDSEQDADVILESKKSPYNVNLKSAKNCVNYLQLNVRDTHTKFKVEENIFAKNSSNYVKDSKQDVDAKNSPKSKGDERIRDCTEKLVSVKTFDHKIPDLNKLGSNDVKSESSSPVIRRKCQKAFRTNKKSETSTGDIIISLSQEEKRAMLLRDFEISNENGGLPFSEIGAASECIDMNLDVQKELNADLCGDNLKTSKPKHTTPILHSNSNKRVKSDETIEDLKLLSKKNAVENAAVTVEDKDGGRVDVILDSDEGAEIERQRPSANEELVKDKDFDKRNGSTIDGEKIDARNNTDVEATGKQDVVEDIGSKHSVNITGENNTDSDWWQRCDGTGRICLVHKRTGMTTYNDIKHNAEFTIVKRSEFVPKGQSPILMMAEPSSVSLTSSGKIKLYDALADSYKQELGVIKWNKIMHNKDPRKFFDEIYKHLPKKSLLPIISLQDNKLVLKKSCHFSKDVVFSKNIFDRVKVIGQLDKKFIVTVTHDFTLILFDQHAVHERIRVEKLYKEYATKVLGKDHEEHVRYKCSSLKKKLIFGVSEEDILILKKYNKFFHRLGLWYTINECEIVLSSVPTCLHTKAQRDKSSEKLKDLVMALIEEEIDVIKKTNGIPASVPQVIQNIVNSEACRGSIMFGDSLDLNKCSELILKLKECNLPFQCAHGRPTLAPIMNVAIPAAKAIAPNLKKLA